MKASDSCKSCIASCIQNKYFAFSHLYSDEKPMDMHIHDCYEIYYSISGGKQFLIDNSFYRILPGDIFFINQYESHYITQVDSQIHERIVFSIYPEFLKSLCSSKTDLDTCFHERNGRSSHKVSLTAEDQKKFLYFVHKLSDISGYGQDIMERAVFSEMMVFLNNRFERRSSTAADSTLSLDARVDEILSYVNQHIAESLSVENLASHFFLSTSYISRLFKASTGTTINKYITAKRITHAKELLSEGYTVSETWIACGFQDYSGFFRSFRKATGLSPKKYSQFAQ